MANRLASATSPYLQQHADNPVDWWPWGPDAFAEAARRDVPVLVSVGYAACHWCHVMAHESFEDPATAALMNEHFVNVKVDREERPDVDAVYMAATQATTGSGGWPMTVVTTTDGRPFFCGTYFPPQRVGHVPAFAEVLAAVTHAWRTRRADLEADAGRLAGELARTVVAARAGAEGGDVVDPTVLARALDAARAASDPRHGGFGGAPKFPPSTLLTWLLAHHARTGDPGALAMVRRTLAGMARGGMYDQLAGGFARYAVDATWTVPHFEKMLSDNALLLRVSLHAWRATDDPLARRVAHATARWLVDELGTPEGGFASSLDADSEGREGAFYAWTPEQLRTALGDDDATWAADLLGVTVDGTFEDGASVLQLRVDPDDPARWASVRARLLAARAARPRPARDDKVVAAWNGLAIGALAEAGALLDDPALVDAARRAATLLADVHTRRDGAGDRLVRTSRDGVAGDAPGVLEDHADVAAGYLTLAAVTGEQRWHAAAGRLLRTVLDRFGDGAGGFHDTADDTADPVLAALRRPQDPTDGPTPGGQPAAAAALLAYAAATGSTEHRAAALAALRVPLTFADRYPQAAGWALATAEAVLDGPREVAVVGPPDDPATVALHRAALAATAPGVVVAVGDPAALAPDAPALLRDRPLVDGRPAAYVCRGFVCDRPVTRPADLARALRA